jgi:hypothetical protein
VACTKPNCRKWRVVDTESLETEIQDSLPDRYFFTCHKFGRRCVGKCDSCELTTCTCTCNECSGIGTACACPSPPK